MERVGIIYGDVGTTEFNCILDTVAEKSEYVQIQHDSCGWVLAQIDAVERHTDLSVEKAHKISSGESVPITEKLIAKVNVIGYRDERNLLQVPHTPFKAGAAVYKAEDRLIQNVIGLETDELKSAYIGLLSRRKIKVQLAINTLIQKHVSIIAKTGAGKSYLTAVLIEELIKHGVTTVVIDPHGEYSSLKIQSDFSKDLEKFGISPLGFEKQIVEYSTDPDANPGSLPLRFTLSQLDARELLALTSLKNIRAYLPVLKSAIQTLHETDKPYTIDDLLNHLESEEEWVSSALITELKYLNEVGIFAEKGTSTYALAQPGKTTIINLRGTPPDIQELVVNRIANALFNLRKLNKIEPLMLVIEEAHNFCPQEGRAASSKILRTIASEGRKFGLGLCIITQRPAKVDKNVLSQCNTQIIMKVTNPLDLKVIAASVEGLTAGMTDEIQMLPVGVAYIAAADTPIPLIVDVRPRHTKHITKESIIKRS